MRLRRTWRTTRERRSAEHDGGAEAEREEVVRDTEESLFAALTESDTGFEALHDTSVDVARRRTRRHVQFGAAAVLLVLLGVLAGRRRS